jgi:hypothetical protein
MISGEITQGHKKSSPRAATTKVAKKKRRIPIIFRNKNIGICN